MRIFQRNKMEFHLLIDYDLFYKTPDKFVEAPKGEKKKNNKKTD